MGLGWGRAGRAWAKACGVSYTHFIWAAMIRSLLRIYARSTRLSSVKYNDVPPCQGFILDPYSVHDFVKETKRQPSENNENKPQLQPNFKFKNT